MKIYERDWENNIVVKDSPIEGKGIFASSDIPQGELLMIISGEVISGRECERREEEDNNVYIFWNGRYYIDTVNTEKIKYINHSCSPNCDVKDRDKNTLNLVAKKDILKGQELTIDYGYDEIYDMCSCEICKEN